MTVTSTPGFIAAGIPAGINPDQESDIAVVATDDGQPVPAAGVFTANKLQAAPVQVSQANLQATYGRAAAIVINSGNANAATGLQGMADANEMCAVTASELDIKRNQVLVCSTGTIGFPLPMDKIRPGIKAAVNKLNSDGGADAATALMTTDTVAKHAVVQRTDTQGTSFTVGAIAKGAAMLEPNMATMLAVLTTDAKVGPAEAKLMLQHAANRSFNTLIVDGAESTNDTVLLLANGRAGFVEKSALQQAFDDTMEDLAIQMADDAEGSTKTVFVHTIGAAHVRDAYDVARGIARSQLIKCSWYGRDPYWGRIAAEAGARAERFDIDTLAISYGDQMVFEKGRPVEPDYTELRVTMEKRQLTLTVDLGQGQAESSVITCDLTSDYIAENMGTS